MGTTVTSKGQVTIPKKIRDHLGIAPGAVVEFEPQEDGRIVLVRKGARAGRDTAKRSRFAALRGTGTVKMSTAKIMALTRSED